MTTGPLVGQVRVASPDGRNQVTVELREGKLYYSLARDRRDVDLVRGRHHGRGRPHARRPALVPDAGPAV
ncbi:MAG: hypothetical protein Q8Q85_10975, partial [Gemmatimonadales bacterium]|nr:hypothetical protein [Gemmatimonadales bacterium]